MIYTDSNYWIALFSREDEFHERAVEMSASLKTEELLISEHCLGEVCTFMLRRFGPQVARPVCLSLLENPRLTVVQASESDWKPTIENASKFNTSFPDAITVMLMEKDGVKRIVSFDSDFDRFPKINRLF